MQRDFFEMFDAELKGLSLMIEAERHTLASLEDREEAALKRQTIMSLEAVLAAVTEARNQIIVAEMNAAATVEKFKKWRGLVVAARAARDAFDLAGKPIEAAQTAADNAENAYFFAARQLGKFTELPLDAYATEPEKAKWERERSKLEGVVNEKSADLRKLKRELADLRANWIRAREAFGQAEFSERANRLPAPPEKRPGVGRLSYVA